MAVDCARHRALDGLGHLRTVVVPVSGHVNGLEVCELLPHADQRDHGARHGQPALAAGHARNARTQ